LLVEDDVLLSEVVSFIEEIVSFPDEDVWFPSLDVLLLEVELSDSSPFAV